MLFSRRYLTVMPRAQRRSSQGSSKQSPTVPEKRSSPNLAQPEPKPLGLFGQMASTAAGVAVGSVVVRRIVSLIPVDRLPLALRAWDCLWLSLKTPNRSFSFNFHYAFGRLLKYTKWLELIPCWHRAKAKKKLEVNNAIKSLDFTDLLEKWLMTFLFTESR